jgi:hypothetical protein
LPSTLSQGVEFDGDGDVDPPPTLHLDIIAIVASSSRIAVGGKVDDGRYGHGHVNLNSTTSVKVKAQVDVNRAVRLSQGPDPFVRRLLRASSKARLDRGGSRSASRSRLKRLHFRAVTAVFAAETVAGVTTLPAGLPSSCVQRKAGYAWPCRGRRVWPRRLAYRPFARTPRGRMWLAHVPPADRTATRRATVCAQGRAAGGGEEGDAGT